MRGECYEASAREFWMQLGQWKPSYPVSGMKQPFYDAYGFVSQEFGKRAVGMTRVCSAMCGSSAGKMHGWGGLMGEGRVFGKNVLKSGNRRCLLVGVRAASLCGLHVTWASSQHRALVGSQASYMGLRASGGSVAANKAEAARQRWPRPGVPRPLLLHSQGSKGVTRVSSDFSKCFVLVLLWETQKRLLPSFPLPALAALL